MALFENFPYTNLHELNLDWLINELNMIKDSAVISVNGQTGEVILYQNATVQFPPVDDNHWSIVRTADGVSRGIVFGNDNRAFICHDSLMNEIYAANNQPPYPVTRVNGQTGDIVLYADQYVQLPSLTDEQIFNWTLFRNINAVAHGIQFDSDGSGYIIDGENRYKIYSQNDAPPYPVTSVNNQTGDVVITFPVTSVNGQTGEVELYTEEATGQIEFPSVTSAGVDRVSMNRELNGVNYGLAIDDSGNLKLIIGNTEYNVYTEYDPGLVDSATDSILNVAHDATGSTWGLMRDTTIGPVGILFSNTIQDSPEAYIRYKDSNDTYQTLKLLTPADIPSSSGVVSINGLNGVVVLSGADLNVSTTDTRKINTVIASLEDFNNAMVYVENTNTATQNIPIGSFVYWNSNPYISIQAIAIGDTLSATNLGSPLASGGMINSIKDMMKPKVIASAVTDGIKTWKQILNALWAQVTANNDFENTYLKTIGGTGTESIYTLAATKAASVMIGGYTNQTVTSSSIQLTNITIRELTSTNIRSTDGTIVNRSDEVAGAGATLQVVKIYG